MFRRISAIFLAAGCTACAPTIQSSITTPTRQMSDFGVLVMAHGGTAEWDTAVERSVAALDSSTTAEVAFGMADPATIQAAVGRLEARGVRRVGVVRLFVSGASWLGRTEQILGIRPGAMARPASPGAGGAHAGHMGPPWRIDSRATFAMSREGLADAPEMSSVLLDRARSLSVNPGGEDLLVVLHGAGDDAEHEQLVAAVGRQVHEVHRQLPFRRVLVEALREDWPEKRVAAEERIRAFVSTAGRDGVTPIVLPYRVQGFGPYAKVLEGLTYRANREGLLPHPKVTEWMARQARSLERGSFVAPLPVAVQPED